MMKNFLSGFFSAHKRSRTPVLKFCSERVRFVQSKPNSIHMSLSPRTTQSCSCELDSGKTTISHFQCLYLQGPSNPALASSTQGRRRSPISIHSYYLTRVTPISTLLLPPVSQGAKHFEGKSTEATRLLVEVRVRHLVYPQK